MNSEEFSRSQPESRTREHLANERTFLAWIRTSLSLIGFGFVLARMGLFLAQLAATGPSEPGRGLRAGHEFVISGMVFLVLGTAMTGWSGWLYHRTLRSIEARDYQPARGSVWLLTGLGLLGGLIIVGLVLRRLIAGSVGSP